VFHSHKQSQEEPRLDSAESASVAWTRKFVRVEHKLTPGRELSLRVVV
jgi:hypothetical protein